MPTTIFVVPPETADLNDPGWQPDTAYLAQFKHEAGHVDQYAEGIPPSLLGVGVLDDGTPLTADTPLPVKVTVPDPPAPPAPPPVAPDPYETLLTAAQAASTLQQLQAAIVAFAQAKVQIA